MEKTWKVLSVFFIAVVVLCCIIGRYFYLMVLSPKNESASQKNYRVERGPILDRNGVVLAIQTRLFRVTGWRPTLKNPDYVAKRLPSGQLVIIHENKDNPIELFKYELNNFNLNKESWADDLKQADK